MVEKKFWLLLRGNPGSRLLTFLLLLLFSPYFSLQICGWKEEGFFLHLPLLLPGAKKRVKGTDWSSLRKRAMGGGGMLFTLENPISPNCRRRSCIGGSREMRGEERGIRVNMAKWLFLACCRRRSLSFSPLHCNKLPLFDSKFPLLHKQSIWCFLQSGRIPSFSPEQQRDFFSRS